MGQIVVVGSSNTDMVVQTPHLPGPGETVLGGTFYQAAGGKGANQAVAAARAGGVVAFIACVGQDAFGDQALAGFVAEGINVNHVVRSADSASGIALIVVDAKGENSIAVASGANSDLHPEAIVAATDLIAQADVVLLQLESPMETVQAAVKTASQHGKTVILNPAPAQPIPPSLWPDLSLLTPNRPETEMLSGMPLNNKANVVTASQVLLEKGVGALVVTLGAEGAFVATPDAQTWVPGFAVQPVDTTGAGDVFNGALAVALAEGAALVEATRFANAAAALSVTKPGAQPSAPQRIDILETLRRI